MAAPQAKKGFLRIRASHLVVVALLFGSVGAYLLLAAQAETSPLYNTDSYTDISLTQGEEDKLDFPANRNFDLYVSALHIRREGPSASHALILISTDRSRVQYKGFTCGTTFTCKKTKTFDGELPEQEYGYINDIVCIDAPRNTDKENILLFTMHMRSLTYLPGSLETDWSVLVAGSAPGTCTSNRDGSGVVWGGSAGSCGGIYFAKCDSGSAIRFGPYIAPSLNPGPKNPGSSKDPGSGQTPSSNAGSGGGGSTANQPDNQPDPLPTESPQGAEDIQPEIEPSPFFDGKLFAVGSETDSSDIQGVSVAGQKFGIGWVYVVGGGIILGTGSFLGLRWWRGLNPVARANFKARFKMK